MEYLPTLTPVLIRSFGGPWSGVASVNYIHGNGKAAVVSSLCWSEWTKSHLPGVIVWDLC